MIAIVTKNDLDSYKHIADSVKNVATWPQYVVEAQMFEVKYFLGDALLNELLTQLASTPEALTEANALLLNGGTYEHCDELFMFTGLKACIIYYAFARFASRSPFNFTQAGITVKESDFSEPASEKAIQRIVTEAKLSGDALRDEVLLFLGRKYIDYPLFKTTNPTTRSGMFYAVGD